MYLRNVDCVGRVLCLERQRGSLTTVHAKTFIYTLQKFLMNCSSDQCIRNWLFSLNCCTFEQVLTLYTCLPFPTSLLVTSPKLYGVSFQNFIVGRCSFNFHSWLLCN